MAAGQRNQSVRFGVSVVLAFFMCMVVASWTATQYFAALLEYQPGLGEAVWSLGSGQKIYQPFSWFFWNVEWINETGLLRDYITRMQLIVVVGAFTSVSAQHGNKRHQRRELRAHQRLPPFGREPLHPLRSDEHGPAQHRRGDAL